MLKLEGNLFRLVEFQHVKPGKGGAFVRTRLKNVETGAVLERTFRAGEKFDEVVLSHRRMQYLYPDGDNFVFMDTETFEQVAIPGDVVGDDALFLGENLDVDVYVHEGKPISLELPPAVLLEVKEAEPWLKGDTTSGATKPVVLETGLRLQVPLFVEEGDTVKVDTRSNEYIERV